MDTKKILEKKAMLLRGLSDNIFKEFTQEEEDILHSKHGYIKVNCGDTIFEGITGAFKVGLDLFVDNFLAIPKIYKICWKCYQIEDENGKVWDFEFVPKKLEDLL